MIDIVIPLGKGSKWDNNELRYSLRSIEKHLYNYRNIYIVGECPKWIKNVIHIPFNETGHGSQNIMLKIREACFRAEISPEFLFWNDDFFLLKNTNAIGYPYYYRGYIYEAIPKNKNNWYQQYVIETLKELESKGLPIKNFDCHTPILYSKNVFVEIMNGFDFNKKLTIKSIYCNSLNIKGQLIEDCKVAGRMSLPILERKIKGKHLFSIGDKCLEPYPSEKESSVKLKLEELYPNPSKYE